MSETEQTHDDIEKNILDAAERLIIHYGYEKTTIADITREAGIARSTLYLRWQKKDDLLKALLWRSVRQYLAAWLIRVEEDPQGGTFAGLFQNGLRALMDTPFMYAMYSNQQSFGMVAKIMGTMDLSVVYAQRLQLTQNFLQRLQAAGVIRQELDPLIAAYVTNCLQFGFLQMQETLPEVNQPSLEKSMDALVEMLDSYLSPPDGGNSDAGKVVIREMSSQFYLMLENIESL